MRIPQHMPLTVLQPSSRQTSQASLLLQNLGGAVQVRVADVAEGGQVSTRRLATHAGRAHKMALSHDAPACFLSCGEDGQVMQHDLREGRGIHRKLLVCKGRNAQVRSHYEIWKYC